MAKQLSRFRRFREQAQALLDERGLAAGSTASKWRRFVHFWVLVWSSFTRNRLPVRASALAYASLLALIPMLAVVVSITSTFLKQEGEEQIDHFIGNMVSSLMPDATVDTTILSSKSDAGEDDKTGTAETGTNAASARASNAVSSLSSTVDSSTNQTASAATGNEKVIQARKKVSHQIHEFIRNTRSGTLGVLGSVLLIFAAISLLTRIEATFNDVWGVAQGRSWFMRIVMYWGVLSLAPLLLVVALGLATGPHLASTTRFIETLPIVGSFIFHLGFQLLPVLVLCITFGAFYKLMPNTRVDWRAALVGGLVGGILFHINNLVSVLYVSRVVSSSKIYGSLGLVPVFMVGLYFCWLILLFGAQVAYAYQNRASYIEERQIETINQRGREFVALRLMTALSQRFMQGERPANLERLSEELCIPTRLIRAVMNTLAAARLVVETAGADTAYLPARPLETITCHDILQALRATQGQEMATRDEPARAEVYGEFQRIEEAERNAASSVTMLALANRAQKKCLTDAAV